MSEIPRWWRWQYARGLRGYTAVFMGREVVSLDGRHWYLKTNNGNNGHEKEDPFAGKAEFQSAEPQAVLETASSDRK
ncbi:hypothetical protein A3E41_04885 [Candidatus Woesebacteria bacterium RIFCSPHIGHO2_12_FULL_38_9]|nr:MAG: hypothetical protein A3E41_04885 [Candidatus Woesebacteria bacterium RIFCSPHIGHO2_12_FULL_38_9]